MSEDTFDPKIFLKSLSKKPGVYLMLGENKQILYVGKAKNLKNRVSSYFKNNIPDPKTQTLVAQIQDVEVIITNSENEALILENNLIKQHHPRYNILFRDDKSYPYIFCNTKHDYPSLSLYRGRKKPKGDYFGPFPNSTAARDTLNFMQKLFKIRQCSEQFFKNRSRPCLQYQIKRCSAPCVNYISKEDYRKDIEFAMLLLQGKNNKVTDELIRRMDLAAENLDYEQAALYRDQIATLRRVQEQQTVSGEKGDVDVVTIAISQGVVCIEVLFIRAGNLLGNKAFFPKVPNITTEQEILAQCLPQYYLNPLHSTSMPKEIIIPWDLPERTWIAEALSQQTETNVKIVYNVRGIRAKWQELAKTNAEQALERYITEKTDPSKRLAALQEILKLDFTPQRIECFDISHTQGEATVASCVVYNSEGPVKSDYRRYNIEGITKGDDYAAMQQALTRRYTKLKQGEGKIPDLILIDGGKGQLHVAEKAIEECQLAGVTILSIAKGPGRKPGLEVIFRHGSTKGMHLPMDHAGLHLLQFIRDEAHRFAITGHRARRQKSRTVSVLEIIPGVGAKRRKQLLQHFGGMQELQRASADDIAKIPGISKKIATLIYETLNPE